MFNAQAFLEEQLPLLRETIRGPAILATSGGVDSTVAAAVVARAVSKDLHCVFVDTGYMRKGEPETIGDLLKGLGVSVHSIDARQEFHAALKGITEPERKRKVIGEKFIRIFERVARDVHAQHLVQGTIAPDWIESGGGLRDTIKSHHNVGGLPADMKLQLVEPLRELYKDEVRKLSRHLELPVSERQPFPGPGLAIRVMGEATPERTEVVREACAIVEEEVDRAVGQGKMERPWQYFAVLLPVKTVGVHGDIRVYGDTIAVRAVQSVDAMSAAYSKIPHDVLERISVRITNQLGNQVNRVVYDITHKPPGTVEWE